MKLKFEKNMRILNDLLGFLHYKGAHSSHMDMEMRPEKSVIVVSAPLPGMPEEELSQLSLILNVPRQREVEQNYWNISGEEDMDAELTLVGMMVDTADIIYQNGTLTITVERLHYSTME